MPALRSALSSVSLLSPSPASPSAWRAVPRAPVAPVAPVAPRAPTATPALALVPASALSVAAPETPSAALTLETILAADCPQCHGHSDAVVVTFAVTAGAEEAVTALEYPERVPCADCGQSIKVLLVQVTAACGDAWIARASAARAARDAGRGRSATPAALSWRAAQIRTRP